MGRCELCKAKFKPIVEGQKFCSATCARAVKDIDELGRVYAVLDTMHLKAYEAQMEKAKRGEGET